MQGERWIVERENQFIYGAWHPFDVLYVSEKVARLAVKYVWDLRFPLATLRVRRVA